MLRRFLLLLLAASASGSLASAQILPEISEPPGNPTTPAKVRLGTALFWEEQLSSNDRVACGTCHRFERGGSDGRVERHPGPDLVVGTDDDVFASPGLAYQDADGRFVPHALFGERVQVTNRRPRSPVNAAFFGELFWDGRARDTFLDPVTGDVVLEHSAALESQAVQPLMNDVEMAHAGRDWQHLVTKLAASTPLARSPSIPEELAAWLDGRDYPALFQEAFGDDAITPARVAMALAAYERTLISDRAPILLDDEASGFVWSELEEEGRFLFENLACATCHPPDNGLFTDQSYHVLGIRPRDEDPGLESRSEIGQDRGRFLTPSLLNVALRAPYFHNGSVATLEEVVEFYDRGGDHGPREIGRIGLSERQKEALVAFLGRPLTDPRLARSEGPFERPALSDELDPPAVAAPLQPSLEPEPRVLVVRGDAEVLADFVGEIAIQSGTARVVAPYETGRITRVVLEGGGLDVTINARAGAGALTIDRLIAFEDAHVGLDGAQLHGTLAVLSGVTLTLDVSRAWIPGDWSGAGTLRLRAPSDDARIQLGPGFGDETFTGTLELVRGVLAPGGRASTQPLAAGRLVLGSSEGRGRLVRPFEAVDYLPDGMPIEVVDGALFLGGQESEDIGPLTLFGRFEVELSARGGAFQPPSNPATHVFADCRDQPWSSDAELAFSGWYDGRTDSDQGVDHVVFRGLTDAQLARVVFLDPVGYPRGTYRARRGAEGELLPLLEF
ncbi:MAG: cytochrome c peroxidase [Planctomycetota bacterium]